MSFAQELKDFSSALVTSYKAFKRDPKEGYYDAITEQAKLGLARERLLLDTASGGGAGAGSPEEAVAGVAPLVGERASSGVLPTFARKSGDPDFERYRAGLSAVESGGEEDPYSAIGETTVRKNGFKDYPIGKFQIMASNVPSWSQQALGKRLTPRELIGNAAAQEAIFADQTKRNLARFGNYGDAASVWHSGRPLSQAGGAVDKLGTRTPDYVRKVLPRDLRVSLDPNEEERPVVFAASGGVIPTLPREVTYAGHTDDAGSNPAELAAEEDLPPDYTPQSFVDVEGARQSLASGLRYIQTHLGLDQQAIEGVQGGPVQEVAQRALASNAGSMSEKEVRQLDKTVDPRGELGNALKSVARYNALYKVYSDLGEPQKAAQMSAGLFMHAKRAAALAGGMAVHAAQKGDVEGAANAIAHAQTNLVPDGSTMKITGTSPQGARFEIEDEKGRVTEKGMMALDEIMRVATGMMNGSEVIRAATNFATSAPTAQEKALEKRRSAVEAYDAAGDQDDDIIMSRMSEAQRKAFSAMDPRDQRDRRKEVWKQIEAERSQANRELARDDKIGDRDYKRDWQALQLAIKQNNFDVRRNDVLTNTEKKLFLYEKDLDDRNKRFEQSQTARRERDAERAKTILEGRGGRAQARGLNIGTKEGAEMRRTAAITDEATRREQEALGGPDPDDPAGRTTVTPEGYGKAQGIRAGASFDRAIKEDDKTRKGKAAAVEEVHDELGQAYGWLDADGKLLTQTKDGKTVPATARAQLTSMAMVGSDIVRGSGLPAASAASVVREVASGVRKPTIINRGADTLVSFGNDMQPMRMSEDGFMQLMRLSGQQALTREQARSAMTVWDRPRPDVRGGSGAIPTPGATATRAWQDPPPVPYRSRNLSERFLSTFGMGGRGALDVNR